MSIYTNFWKHLDLEFNFYKIHGFFKIDIVHGIVFPKDGYSAVQQDSKGNFYLVVLKCGSLNLMPVDRLIWIARNGLLSIKYEDEIIHINGDQSDNRIINLRLQKRIFKLPENVQNKYKTAEELRKEEKQKMIEDQTYTSKYTTKKFNRRYERIRRNVRSKLSNYDIKAIRALKGRMSHRELGRRFGVDNKTIYLILHNKTYKDVKQ